MSHKRCCKWSPLGRASRAWGTFMLTLLIVSLQYPSAKIFTHCTSEYIEFGFSLKIMIFFRRPYRWYDSNLPCLPWRWWSFDINEWCSLPLSATKHCLIEAVVCCDTFVSVVNARWHSNPLYKCSSRISQWAVSSLSLQPTNSEPAVNAQYGLQPPRLLFLDGCAKSEFSRKNLTRLTHWCNGWRALPKCYSQERRIFSSALRSAWRLEVTIFQHLL